MWRIFIFILFIIGMLYNLVLLFKTMFSKKDESCKSLKKRLHAISAVLFALLALSRLEYIILQD